MESTSTPDNGRQSRGLSRFWPVHGTPAPGQRHSDDESASSEAESSGPLADTDGPLADTEGSPVAGSGPTGEQPQVDAVRPAPRAGETHLLALGSRRLPEIVNGGRPSGPSGFPPPETERDARAAEPGPRHGGPPIPTGLPGPGSPLRSAPDAEAGSGSPFRPASAPFAAGSPFAPATPFGPRPPRRSSDLSARSSGGPAAGRFRPGPPAEVGTADQDRDARRAAGWASLPTSGVPTLAGGSTITPGTPVADAPPGGRRSRDDEPRIAVPRRSTTLDDAEEPRPRAGRRAAPETADDMDERADRRPDSDGGDEDAAAKVDDAPAEPNADREDGAHARTDRDDGADAQTDGGGIGSARVDTGRDVSTPAETAGDVAVGTTAEADDDTASEADADTSPEADASRETDTSRETDPDTSPDADADDAVRDIGDRIGSEADADRADGGRPNAATKVDAPLRPGDVDETLIAFWDEKAVQRFRSEWHEVKADFVDDPVAALTRAHDLVTEAVDDLTEALLAERDELDPLRDTSTPDTESMRMAMRGYREFLDRILAL